MGVAAPPICLAAASGIVVRTLDVPAAAVSARAGTGNNGQPECHLSAPASHVAAVVNVDSSPQPYQRLERMIVEDGQQFATQREFAPPQAVTGLGLDAAWIPALSQLVTSDGKRLIMVSVSWPHARASGRRGLAAALARLYLHG